MDHHTHCGHAHCFSWTAILVGALAAIGISFLFNAFNLGTGLSAFSFSQEGLATIAIGGAIWLVICAVISMFIAGWITGRVAARRCAPALGCLHGFVAWCLALFLGIIFLSHFANVMPSPNFFPQNAKVNLSINNQMSKNNNANGTTTAMVEHAANVAGGATLLVFFIFGLGAIFATIGGHMGAKYQNKKYPHTTTNNL